MNSVSPNFAMLWKGKDCGLGEVDPETDKLINEALTLEKEPKADEKKPAANEKKPGLIALPVCLDDIASTPAANLEPTLASASSSSAAAGSPAESHARHRVRCDESELAEAYKATWLGSG